MPRGFLPGLHVGQPLGWLIMVRWYTLVSHQGLTLVHFSAQQKRFLWDSG